MNLVPRFVFRREIVQFLGIFLKTERALDALGPERRPAVRTRMHPLSALVDVPALVARRLRAAQMPDESRAPAYRTVPVLPNVVLRIGGGKRLARGFEPRLHAVVHKERQQIGRVGRFLGPCLKGFGVFQHVGAEQFFGPDVAPDQLIPDKLRSRAELRAGIPPLPR